MLVDGLVTTIIPVHNRPVMLREAVNSVLAQTHRPIEIIVVDDGSTDCTLQVALALADEHPGEVHVVATPNGGPGAAREAGRQKARGSFIQYLDSDDILLPNKFDIQVAGLMQRLDCDVSYGKTHYRTDRDDSLDKPWKRTGEKIETMFPSMAASRWWGTSTPLYRRGVIDRAGPWLPLICEEDWEYDCRIASFDIKLHYCDSFVSVERRHEGNRLSSEGSTDPRKLRDRARAHEAILGHARKAGIPRGAKEMQHFARELFLLSRQCGAAELKRESKHLFQLAREASLPHKAASLDFRAYALAARAIGWRTMGRLALQLDMLRK